MEQYLITSTDKAQETNLRGGGGGRGKLESPFLYAMRHDDANNMIMGAQILAKRIKIGSKIRFFAIRSSVVH